MKNYEIAFDYNLFSSITVKAKSKSDAKELAEEIILNKINEIMEAFHNNEQGIDFQDGSLELAYVESA